MQDEATQTPFGIAELKLSHGPAEVTQWAFLDRSTNVGKMWENLKENPSQNALRGVFGGATGTTFKESNERLTTLIY